MDVHRLEHLTRRQQQALGACLQKTSQWEKFKRDFDSLRSRLQSLPTKTRHEVMVPIGGHSSSDPPLAFMSAFIHHTNEIMVLLGDNWFVERSASQAMEIVDRRAAKCQAMLESLAAEREQLEKWLRMGQEVADETQDLVEIVEEYDEEQETRWRENHKRKVFEQKQREAQDRAEDMEKDNLLHKLEKWEIEERSESKAAAAVEPKSILKRASFGGREERSKSVSFDDDSPEVVPEPFMFGNQVEEVSKPREKEREGREQVSAFNGEVFERNVHSNESQQDSATDLKNKEKSSTVSRFKANRR